MKQSDLLFTGKPLRSILQIGLSEVRIIRVLLLLTGLLNASLYSFGQNAATGAAQTYTLKDCIEYALQNQPSLKQSILSVSIAKTNNAINLSGWLPQVNGAANLVHYTQVPTSIATNPADPTGPVLAEKSSVVNTFIPALSGTQTILPQHCYTAL